MSANKGSDLMPAFLILNSENCWVGVEGLVAVQWEPTGRSNRAIPLGGTGDNSSQPVHTSKELPDSRTKPPIDSDSF